MAAERRYNAHTIGAGGWVVRQDGAVLLVRMGYGLAKDRLMMPGGRAADGEPLEATAIREVREETGLDVTARGLLMVRQRVLPDERNLYFVFWMQPVGGQLQADGREVTEALWLMPAEVVRRDDVASIAHEVAVAWLAAPRHVLARREVWWQDQAAYHLWTGSPETGGEPC